MRDNTLEIENGNRIVGIICYSSYMAADFKLAVTEAAEGASRNVAELLVVRSFA